MKKLSDIQINELIQKANLATSQGCTLQSVFKNFATSNNRAEGSVRNNYYRLLKIASKNDLFKQKFFSDIDIQVKAPKCFDEIEERNLLNKVLLGRTVGRSVRSIINTLADNDPSKALRFQNKYRNLLKYNQPLVESVMTDIKIEYGKCHNPYEKYNSSKNLELINLQNQINSLADRLIADYKSQNDKLKNLVKQKDELIEKLTSVVKNNPNTIESYFDIVKNKSI